MTSVSTNANDCMKMNTNNSYSSPDDDRILVQCGTTYWVEGYHIIPAIYECYNHNYNNKKKNIIVYSETNNYCKSCLIHTIPYVLETFVEIGCDKGELKYKMTKQKDILLQKQYQESLGVSTALQKRNDNINYHFQNTIAATSNKQDAMCSFLV